MKSKSPAKARKLLVDTRELLDKERNIVKMVIPILENLIKIGFQQGKH